MSLKNSEEQNALIVNSTGTNTRLDKAISNQTYYSSIKAEEQSLVRDLTIFLAHGFQTDLFGYSFFDPIEFCTKMGYTRPRLYDIIIQDESVLPEFRTRIGNALNTIYNAHFDIAEEFINSVGYHRGKRKITILNELFYVEGVRNKTFFKIKMDESFKSNINSFFYSINLNSYVALRQKNSSVNQSLYLYCSKLKNKITNSETGQERLDNGVQEIESVNNFSKICEQVGLSYKDPSRNKAALIKAFDEINAADPELKCYLHFGRNKGGRHKFVPILKFSNLSPNDVAAKKELRVEIFASAVEESLIEFYSKKFLKPNEMFDEEKKSAFRKWFSTAKYAKKDKARIFTQLYNSMFPFPIKEDHQFVNKFVFEQVYTVALDEPLSLGN